MCILKKVSGLAWLCVRLNDQSPEKNITCEPCFVIRWFFFSSIAQAFFIRSPFSTMSAFCSFRFSYLRFFCSELCTHSDSEELRLRTLLMEFGSGEGGRGCCNRCVETSNTGCGGDHVIPLFPSDRECNLLNIQSTVALPIELNVDVQVSLDVGV